MRLALFLLAWLVTFSAHAAGVRVLALGDSLTEGYGLSKEVAWPALVEAALKEKGYKDVTIVNAGVSGSTSASGVSRLRWHLNGKDKPQIVIIALGANDGLRGLKLEATKQHLLDVIKLAKEKGMTPLLAGMRMPPNYGAEYTEKFAKMYPELAESEKIALIPFLLEGVGGEPSLNLADGIHPNEKGYKIVAQTVLKSLEPLIKDADKDADKEAKKAVKK